MARMLDLARSWKYFAGFFLLALVAFWPTYLSQVRASSPYTHLHAATAAAWMLMLVAQSWAIGARRVAQHKLFGKASYALAPLVLVSILLLGHDRIGGVSGEAYAIQTYILYLQLSLAVLFGLSYGLAIWNRRSVALHSRFMVCTALTLIDPVTIRLLFWADPTPAFNYQWLTFALTDLVLVALIWLERHNRAGRAVFPAMLGLFVLAQLPALLGLTDGALWQGFARWFAAL
ncbi:MAG TPA: hypothetical protein VEW71_03130 [Allosphingosinicella sp.]|nr:hypothetical protein [Allosphingosinicella sp.]